MRPLGPMVCVACGQVFAPTRVNARYCGPRCARRAQEARYQARLVAPPPARSAVIPPEAEETIRRMLGRGGR